VETEEQVESSAALVARLGLKLLRGGAFKPRSSPYSFQGLGEQGLQILAAAAKRHGLQRRDRDHVRARRRPGGPLHGNLPGRGSQHAELALLKALGETKRPILLKRSMMGTSKSFSFRPNTS